ncbi:MAG: cupin domain-containing protein [Armatimonadota bacterium]
MIFRRDAVTPVEVEGVHDGQGKLVCRDMLAGHTNNGRGFKFIHDNVLEPGGTIGEHMHQGDEEVYFILTGRGVMIEDGIQNEINAGDLSLVQSGHSHGLINSPDSSMHFIVIGIDL